MATSKKPRPVLHVAGGAKPAGDPAPSTAPAQKPAGAAPLDRTALVAVAAYYRAEKRNFSPGGELEDWVMAEREVDEALSASSRPSASAG